MTPRHDIDISVREINGVSVVRPEGIIDFYNAPAFKGVISGLIEHDKRSVVINLEKTIHIDSSGIGALITAMVELKKIGGELKVCVLNDSVKKIFEILKADELIEICGTEAEAVERFRA